MSFSYKEGFCRGDYINDIELGEHECLNGRREDEKEVQREVKEAQLREAYITYVLSIALYYMVLHLFIIVIKIN